jgi:predicted anti-sigma-YlaC factor YlaD
MLRRVAIVLCTLLSVATAACSPATLAMNRMADALTATAAAYARDDDPELVRVAAPATLKMVEMMLETQPSNHGLLLTACSGFAQYAYAFLQVESEIVAPGAAAAAGELRQRSGRMYARARGYCLQALGTRNPPLANALRRDLKSVIPLLDSVRKTDVPALFWTASAWAGEFTLADDQLVRLEELAVIRALLSRALALDEAWEGGTIHETMIAVDGLPVLLGGSAERARKHFDRALALSEGQSAFAYVTLASSVALTRRDRSEFERLLKQALAIDVSRRPSLRLANLVAQKRARFLLASADRLFR